MKGVAAKSSIDLVEGEAESAQTSSSAYGAGIYDFWVALTRFWNKIFDLTYGQVVLRQQVKFRNVVLVCTEPKGMVEYPFGIDHYPFSVQIIPVFLHVLQVFFRFTYDVCSR